MANERTNAAPALTSTAKGNRLEVIAEGSWTVAYADAIEKLVSAMTPKLAGVRDIAINMRSVGELDTLGAWLLERLARSGREQGGQAGLVAVPGHYQGLFDEIHNVNRRKPAPRASQTR